jgi:nitrogen-specific signal transduction histidine kinase/putative methionine-R-sulfoxide reductase with GAF domain
MSRTERVRHTELDPDHTQLLIRQLTDPQQTDAQVSALDRLQGIVENVNRFYSPEQRLDVLLRAFLQYIPTAQQGTIYLGTASDRTFIIGATIPGHPHLIGTETDVQGGYVEAVAQVKCPVLLPEMQQETSALSERACAAQSALVVPFIVGGKTVGVLSLENRESCAFSQQDLDFAALLSSYTAMVVDNARLLMIQPHGGEWATPELNVIQALAQSLPIGVLVVKQDKYQVWGNLAFCEMTGFEQNELESHLYRIHRFLAQDASDLVALTQPRPYELTLTRRNKTSCPTRALVVGFDTIGIRYAKGYVGIFEDLGEKSTLERELFHMQKFSNIGSLVSGAAHELNNPLTAVVGFAELLLSREDIPSELRTDLRTIVRQAERSVRVTRDLVEYLDLSIKDPIQIDVNYIVSQLVRFRMYMIETDNLNITLDLAQPSPQILGNAQQIQQVLLNLIDNAEHACVVAGKPCHLQIATETLQRGERVKISVRDNGPGIPEEIQSRIFEPFFTTEPTGERTGLGLTVSRQIIALHGGHIRLESKPGKGSTFFVDLPAAHAPGAATQGDRCTPSARKTVPPARILVVDDETSISKLLTRVLTRTGHRVDSVPDGREALAKLQNNIYDIVFLDIKIPILPGQAVYAWIKRNQSNLLRRTVVLTGDTLNAETIDFLEQEHAIRLFKPFQLVELRTIMDRIWPG